MEAPAAMRGAAGSLWQWFAALTEVGFSEAQALAILGDMVKSAVAAGPKQ